MTFFGLIDEGMTLDYDSEDLAAGVDTVLEAAVTALLAGG